VLAAVAGTPVDTVPAALWRHFPKDDQRAESLAAAHVAFQQQYEWDFLKVTPTSGYYGDDWGLRAGYRSNREGTRHYSDRPIKKPGDWSHLKNLDVTSGVYGRELHVLRLIRSARPQDLVLSTIFSPLSIAKTLAGEQGLVRYLRETPEDLLRGLEIITEVTTRFAAESTIAGADGIFFATQCASTNYLTVEEYAEFGRPFDLRVLEATEGAAVRLLHLHGHGIMFDELIDYPVEIVNWHDRRTSPTLAEAHTRFPGALAGGLNELDTLGSGTVEQITAEVRDAIAQTKGIRHIVTGGCVVPIDVPDDRLHAARTATRTPAR